MSKGRTGLEEEMRQDKDLANKINWVEEALTKRKKREIVI
jgi:hypothetical protein